MENESNCGKIIKKIKTKTMNVGRNLQLMLLKQKNGTKPITQSHDLHKWVQKKLINFRINKVIF